MHFDKEKILELLDQKRIEYKAIEHAAVFNMQEMEALHVDGIEDIAKNLFVRDKKKRNYYLIVSREDKPVDLKKLQATLGSKPLGFASEDDLEKFLGLSRGAVTPFGILNDDSRSVRAIVDESFRNGRIGVHPNDNAATVFLSTSELIKLIVEHGNTVEFTPL